MNYRKTLLALMVFFFLIWFVLPLVSPVARPIIFQATLPIRYLGIFVHEMGHGLFTLFSFGNFHWFQMGWDGGVAITSGGVRAATLLGGLLGPTLLGVLLLIVSTRAKKLGIAYTLLYIFFFAGMYYTLKPLWLSRNEFALLDRWSPINLLGLTVPLGMTLLTLKIGGMSERVQRHYLQILGIFMCYSGYVTTDYIFMYQPLGNGMYSDVRVLAATFWGTPESVSFPRFFITAVAVSVANFSLMAWGVYRALKAEPSTVDRP